MHPEDLNNSSYSYHPENSADLPGSTHSTHYEPTVILEAGHPPGQSRPGGTKHTARNTLTIVLFYLSILFFIIGFNFSDVMVGNWYQQFLPNLGSRQISDITFLDSLTGWAVATQTSDTSYILKTINGGDNWQIIFRNFFAMTNVQFLNSDTGFVCGGYLYKTTDGGFNWAQLNTPSVTVENMQVINKDTILFVNSNSLVGGVFFTSTGGASWTVNNTIKPDKIYMYNRSIGFCSRLNTFLYKTTDGGLNWVQITGTDGYMDIVFSDSLTGWKASTMTGNYFLRKTINGGLNWFSQTLPTGGIVITSGIVDFSMINSDTLYGVGGTAFYGAGQFRGIVYRTTNGGSTWLFQVPDTTIHLTAYSKIQFIGHKVGWAYNISGGIHTVLGGDPVWLTPVEQINTEVPNGFKLFQNYPNPFNPKTIIRFQINRLSDYQM